MNKNDEIGNIVDILTEFTQKRGDPKEKDDIKKSARVEEEKDTIKGDPIGKAKEEIGLDLLARIRKIVPSAVSLAWIVFAFAVIVIVSSLLFLWCSYVYSIWDKPKEILPLLVKARDLAAATALGALLTYTRLRR